LRKKKKKKRRNNKWQIRDRLKEGTQIFVLLSDQQKV